MNKDTKEALYSLLDLMDIFSAKSFINIDKEKMNIVRDEILKLISGEMQIEATVQKEATDISLVPTGQLTKEFMLATLLEVLLNQKNFSKKEDLLDFAKNELKLSVKDTWYKSTRASAIGNVMVEFDKQDESKYEEYYKVLSKFEKRETKKSKSKSGEKTKSKTSKKGTGKSFTRTILDAFETLSKEEN